MDDPRGNMEQHQPPPSLWPVGFAVGIVCLLVGLVVSWVVAAVGAAIAVVCGFLWARDVMSGRPAPAVAAPASAEGQATDAPAIPADQGEAAMPEPAPGERFPRSKFLEGTTLGLGAIIGGVVTLPVIGFAVMPAFLKQHGHEVDLGPLENFPEGEYVVATFLREPAQGEVSRRTAFIRNNGQLHGKPSFTCISNRCAHLGCPVQPGGPTFDKKTKQVTTASGHVSLIPSLPAAGFICPCHGGAYDQEGNRIAGPPVRGLDRFEFWIRHGHLILGNTFSVAQVTGTGANAEIKRYELAGPGQHVDGIESWLYPLQPPH